jgi:hypothetical protein
MARHANERWELIEAGADRCVADGTIHAALLMDLRDRLDRLLRVLECPRFARIPGALDDIVSNTRRRRRPAATPK